MLQPGTPSTPACWKELSPVRMASHPQLAGEGRGYPKTRDSQWKAHTLVYEDIFPLLAHCYGTWSLPNCLRNTLTAYFTFFFQ